MGPFDFWTTASSGESAGAAGAAWLETSADFSLVHPASSAAADAANAVRPKSLRLKTVEEAVFEEQVPHVPHPFELQSPQSLVEEPRIFRELFIRPSLCRSRHNGRVLKNFDQLCSREQIRGDQPQAQVRKLLGWISRFYVCRNEF